MKNKTETIRKFVQYLNNKDKDGGFWLPNIQRPFVWKEEQIERIYDSILREYPIGTLLVWKTKSEIKRRKFIDNYKDNLRLPDFTQPVDKNLKMLVLDGQQRLQSLYIGLIGSYNKKELYFNILSGDLTAPEDIKYDFKFLINEKVQFPWIKFKDIIFSDKKIKYIKRSIIKKNNITLSDQEDDRLEENIELARSVFCTQENIIYQEVDSIDRPETYSEDDIVEIFIRANSGGTPLGKSDLLFSLLSASWEDADDNVADLLVKLNETGYKFTRDFILKTCLVILNTGAKYVVKKFRDEDTRRNIIENWVTIAEAIYAVKDFIYGSTFMKTDKTMPSYLSLIPLIYFRYHYKKDWKKYFKSYQKYLLRTSLTGTFGGSPDNLLDKLIKDINTAKGFDINSIFNTIREDGRNLEISKDLLLALNYWKKEIHLLFNLWYGFNYQPAYQGNNPQIDHIFPQSKLKKIKIKNPNSEKMNIMKYKWPKRDQIANLMLLTATENGAGGKGDLLPGEWFEGKSKEYLQRHLIPENKDLWKIENFEYFIEERKKLIINKFNFILFKDQ